MTGYLQFIAFYKILTWIICRQYAIAYAHIFSTFLENPNIFATKMYGYLNDCRRISLEFIKTHKLY